MIGTGANPIKETVCFPSDDIHDISDQLWLAAGCGLQVVVV
jgi:hypothetical protein